MKLRTLAHSRTGDKGDIINISVIPYRDEDYNLLKEKMTIELVARHFMTNPEYIKRYELPLIQAFNFVIEKALNGGVTRSIKLDKHGKSLSSFLLEIDII